MRSNSLFPKVEINPTVRWIDQVESKNIACRRNTESNEAELTPSFTFGVIDDANISEEVLDEGVHAQKPTEIQRIADNMSNNPLSTQKNEKNHSEFNSKEEIYNEIVFDISTKFTNNRSISLPK